MNHKNIFLDPKEKIINYLKTYDFATTNELSQALSYTKPNIIYHLNSLLQENLIQTRFRHDTRVGRPEKEYFLTENSFIDNIPHLCKSLLQVFLEHTDNSSIYTGIEQLAESIIPYHISSEANLLASLPKTIETLNQYQYQSTWEASSNGTRIIFKNCPYLALAQEFPQLCTMDRIIIEKLTGYKACQIQKISPDAIPLGKCTFQIKSG